MSVPTPTPIPTAVARYIQYLYIQVQGQANKSHHAKGALSRRKRDLLFLNGVKLCSQETVQQAMDNHLHYFHLRVCQETVWEAFKIFWDRLPERDEYQFWMEKCQDGTVNVQDIGRSFSQSPEHIALVQDRVAMASSDTRNNHMKIICYPEWNGDSGHQVQVESAQPAAEEEVTAQPAADADLSGTPEDTGDNADALSPETTEEAVEQPSVEGISLEDISVVEEEVVDHEGSIGSVDVIAETPHGEAAEGTSQQGYGPAGVAISEVAPEEDSDEDGGESEIAFEPTTEDTSEVSEVVIDDDDSEITSEHTAEPSEVIIDVDDSEIVSEPTEDTEEMGEVIIDVDEDTHVIIDVTPEDEEDAPFVHSPEEQVVIEESPDVGIYDEQPTEKELLSEEAVTAAEVVIESENTDQVAIEEEVPEVPENPIGQEVVSEDPIGQEEKPEEAIGEEVVLEESEPETETPEPEAAIPEEASSNVAQTEEELPDVVVEEAASEELPTEAMSVPDNQTPTATTTEEHVELDTVAEEILVEEISEGDTVIPEAEVIEALSEDAHSPVDLEYYNYLEEEGTPEVTVQAFEADVATVAISEDISDDATSEIHEDLLESVDVDADTLSPAATAEETTAAPEEESTSEATGLGDVLEAVVEETIEEAVVEVEGAVEVEIEDAEPEPEPEPAVETVPSVEPVPEDASQNAPEETVVDIALEDSSEDTEDSSEDTTGGDDAAGPDEAFEILGTPETIMEEVGSDTIVELMPEPLEPATIEEDIEVPAEESAHTVESVKEIPLVWVEEPTSEPTEDPNAPAEVHFGDIMPDEETVITNEIDDIMARPMKPMGEHIVELSIKLKGEFYDDSLRDPSSYYYQNLAEQFTMKIEEAFDRLPGFKNVFVLDFKPQKELQGGLGVVVYYAITLEGDAAGLSNETMDYITLQSNLVGSSYEDEPEEIPTVVYTITDFRNYIAEALHKDNFIGNTTLDVDPDTLQLEHVETLMPFNNTDRDFDSNDLDDILAAEKPPDGTGQDTNDHDHLFLKKDDFLFDPVQVHDSWVEPPSMSASENDVLNLEDTTIIIEDVFASAPLTIKDDFGGSGSGFSWEEQGFSNLPWASENTPLDGYVGNSVSATEILDKPKSPHGADQETPVEEQNPEPETFMDHVLVTQDIRSNPQYTMTEEVPVFMTMEPLTVELSMHTVEASGMYDEFYPSEATTMYSTVTEVPLSLASDAPLDDQQEMEVTEEALEVNPQEEVVIVPEDQGAKEEDGDTDTELPSTVSIEDADDDTEDEKVSGGGVEVLEETGKNIEQLATAETSEGEIPNEELVEDEVISVSVTTTTAPAPTAMPVTTTTPASTTQSTPLSAENESPFTHILNASSDNPPVQVHKPSTLDETRGDTYADIESYFYFDEFDEMPEYDDEEASTVSGQAPTSTVILNSSTHNASDLSFFDDSDNSPTVRVQVQDSHTMELIDQASIAMPSSPGRALMVFFSLRVTNMRFSDDLFNKSSAEYKSLEQRFLELLVPYLQSNLTNFDNLEILNFRNGSVVVNSRMKFVKPVQHEVTTVVYLILEDFCNTAYQTMNLAIDKYSLDVESGEKADPCKFQACNEYSKCAVNRWSGEAECVCNPGYFSVDGLPCQSICELQEDFCQNDGKCDIIPGKGAICRCRVGENWWYRGERCEEYVSEPLVVGVAVASIAGFLLVAAFIIFFLARTLRDGYEKDDSEDPLKHYDSDPSLERATKYNPMFESEVTVGYNQFYRRYPDGPDYNNLALEGSPDMAEGVRKAYEEEDRLTKEEIEDRIRILELYATDQQFANFMRQHQVLLDNRRDSTSSI
ncbi:interphotoreceptor matrix proteoglycan 2-like [Engraulis encrasicolus]|uniref:interphotoreceptor matrix proteoglycan 2-like n=1 Tax=Engraulis encrasicolus TaxID=184585 RepID=UPI002FCEF28C